MVVADAQACAATASARAGVRVVEMSSVAQIAELGALLVEVWQAPNVNQVADPGLVRALAHAGNYVFGAYRDRALVGATWAFLGRHEPERGLSGTGQGMLGEVHLHSHITGVLPADRGGTGYALKQHQRAWALARGIGEVHWTFDPLIRRNAYFNVQKLGAVVTRYLPDFYGPMDDGINTGDTTDRLYAVWKLDSPLAVAAAQKPLPEPPGGGEMLLDEAEGIPVARPAQELAGAEQLLVATPPDIEQVRAKDAELAAGWRAAMRDALGGALASGYRVAGVDREGRYVLRRDGV